MPADKIGRVICLAIRTVKNRIFCSTRVFFDFSLLFGFRFMLLRSLSSIQTLCLYTECFNEQLKNGLRLNFRRCKSRVGVAPFPLRL